MGLAGELEVFVADEQAEVIVDAPRWRELATAVLADEGVRGDVEVSVVFVDADAMAELNARYMGETGPTDVLAFPIDDDRLEAGRSPDIGRRAPVGRDPDVRPGPLLLGDIVVCPSVAAETGPANAGSYPGHTGTVADELALLIVHGILHVLGMDHAGDDQREAMQERERQHLAAHYRAIAS